MAAWMMRGLIDYLQAGELFIAPRIKEEIAAYRSEQNNIAQFVDSECELGKKFEVRKLDLYTQYKFWADAREFFVKNDTDFSKELARGRPISDARKRTKEGERHYVWIGIRLKPRRCQSDSTEPFVERS